MHDHRTQEAPEESTYLDQAILGLLLGPDAHHPLSETEIVRAISVPGHVPSALKRLRTAGLIQRWNDLVTASRPAVRFHEITQLPGRNRVEESERRYERSVLELLLSDAGKSPLSEKEIRRALSTKKKRRLAVVDALHRLDGAGLVDCRGELACDSEPARCFEQVMTL
jgi:hypothetical protein